MITPAFIAVRDEAALTLIEEVLPLCTEQTVVELSVDQMRQMTKSRQNPLGFDFSSSTDGSCRHQLYRLRETVQEHESLYFRAAASGGLAFTTEPLLGMIWREQDFADACARAHQLTRMWERAMSECRERGSRLRVPLPTIVARAQELERARNDIQEAIADAFRGTKQSIPANPKRARNALRNRLRKDMKFAGFYEKSLQEAMGVDAAVLRRYLKCIELPDASFIKRFSEVTGANPKHLTTLLKAATLPKAAAQ